MFTWILVQNSPVEMVMMRSVWIHIVFLGYKKPKICIKIRISINTNCFEIKTFAVLFTYRTSNNYCCMLDSAHSKHICCCFNWTQIVKRKLHKPKLTIPIWIYPLITSTFLFLFLFSLNQTFHALFVMYVWYECNLCVWYAPQHKDVFMYSG